MSKKSIKDKRNKIKRKIRSIIQGTETRPRLSVFRSNLHIYAQLVDDTKGVTLAAFSSAKLEKSQIITKVQQANQVGIQLAKLAITKGIKTCSFDRNGYLYHGRVQAIAEGAREGGLII